MLVWRTAARCDRDKAAEAGEGDATPKRMARRVAMRNMEAIACVGAGTH